MNYCDIRVSEFEPIEPIDIEQKQGFVMHDGKSYLIIENGTIFLCLINNDEAWI